MKKKHITILSVASLAVLAVTTLLILKRRQALAGGEVPPPGAPQLPIQNPGDQSDFPAGPSDERELG